MDYIIDGANDNEIEVQPPFNNLDTLRNGNVITREVRKRADGAVKRPRAAGLAMVGVPSTIFTYNQAALGRIAQPAIDVRYYGGGGGTGKAIIGQVGVSMMDFNPALFRGYRGGPGIKIRANQRTFQYANTLLRQILDREIVHMQIPDVHQRIEEIFAEVTICNIHVSNYRPPNCLNIYPAPPNLIVVNVEDLDIGVTGNLDGIANIILPIQLCGIVHANFYHVSASITLKLEPSAYGTPQVVLCGCDIQIPFADVCIECGGLLGTLANLFFRQDISKRVRSMVPGRVCAMLPQIISERINPMLARIPQSVSFTQIASLFTELLEGSIPAHCRSPQCQAHLMRTKLSPGHSGFGAPPPRNPPLPAFNHSISAATGSKNSMARAIAFAPTQVVAQQIQSEFQDNVGTKGKRAQLFGTGSDRQVDSGTSAVWGIRDERENHAEHFTGSGLMTRSNAQSFGQPTQMILSTLAHPFARKIQGVARSESFSSNNTIDWGGTVHPPMQQSQQTIILRLTPKELYAQELRRQQQKAVQKLPVHLSAFPEYNSKSVPSSGQYTVTSSDQLNKSAVHGVPVAVSVSKGYGKLPGDYKSGGVFQAFGDVGGFKGRSDPCAGCPVDSFGAIGNLIKQQLDLRKVANLVLTTQLLRTYATFYDYNLDLNGEFSPNGRGGTPFGPFPMQWPTSVGLPMIEILISDFTLNSLLYWMHRTNFLSFRIGPETPSIGPLLTTTCDVSNDYSGDESENESLLLRLLRLSQRRRHYSYHQQRSKRQAITGGDSSGSNSGSLGDLADLGICLGDIMPAVKEKYPNRTLALFVHSTRAPSITFSRRGGGSVQLDLVVFVDIYLDKTNVRVGTILVTAAADIMLRIVGRRIIANASLPLLKLIDRDQTLGLQQDALDNLASLAKDLILKAANQQFSRGMEISVPTLSLPVNIANPQVQLLDHSIYIGSDYTIAPSAIQMLS
ncbi:hypothetical protein LOAG_01329 [Loa loa]|uniref:BPI2 domain-containing protein n=1 Tax=Loa loa TaxID=7209 RepID=A0A1I7VPG1_LOALO|nr:hypothetical protein LOAG_01329 [Loa loa]EFO27155.1 hypothetical protein LOAG_01329 [Loa loa]